jgi:hypothetical protein
LSESDGNNERGQWQKKGGQEEGSLLSFSHPNSDGGCDRKSEREREEQARAKQAREKEREKEKQEHKTTRPFRRGKKSQKRKEKDEGENLGRAGLFVSCCFL